MWEQRWHPLRREWVILAAHRDNRPWKGERVADGNTAVPAYDPDCTFCPGNARISGLLNPDYRGVFAFDNDHPCVGAGAPRDLDPAPVLYRNRAADGVARVVCYTPRHDLSLSRMDVDGIDALLTCWQEQYRELKQRYDELKVAYEKDHPHSGVIS